MEAKNSKEFLKSTELCSKIDSQLSKSGILLIVNFFATTIFLWYIYSQSFNEHDEGVLLIGLVIFIGIISCTSCYKGMKKFSTLAANLSKNKLEIKSASITGTYTDTPTSPDNEKYFKIPFNQIERIELKEPDLKENEFFNFVIHHTDGKINLAIDSPSDAKNIIQNLLGNLENKRQIWECPRCRKVIQYGQANCDKCNQAIIWQNYN